MKKIICIYKVINPLNKIYIGQTTDFEKRVNTYFNLNCKGQKLLFNSFMKYGVDNHRFEILHICEIEDLDNKEIYYISKYMTNRNKYTLCHGLNLSDGGNGNRGYKPIVSEELRRKRSEISKTSGIGYKVKNGIIDLKGNKNPFYNKKHSDKSKEAMSLNHSKSFEALSPEGKIEIFLNGKEFALKNNCCLSLSSKCLKGKLKSAFGWTNFKYIKNAEKK